MLAVTTLTPGPYVIQPNGGDVVSQVFQEPYSTMRGSHNALTSTVSQRHSAGSSPTETHETMQKHANQK